MNLKNKLRQIAFYLLFLIIASGIITALHFTKEPLTICSNNGIDYVIQTSQGETYREATLMDYHEGRITNIGECE